MSGDRARRQILHKLVGVHDAPRVFKTAGPAMP